MGTYLGFLTVAVHSRNCGRVLCRGLLAWTGKQQHDPGGEGGSRSGISRVLSEGQWFQDTTDGLAGVHGVAMDAQDMHDHLLLANHVCVLVRAAAISMFL